MVLRTSATAVFVCLASLGSLTFAQTQTVSSYVFALPGANSSGPFYVYTANPFAPVNALTASPGTYQILGKPDGSKFYLIANAGATAVSEITSSFSSVQQIGGVLSLPAVAAAISPDGKRLVVVTGSQSGGSGTVYVFDTSTDSLVVPNGIPVGATPVDVAISQDSARIFVAGTTGAGTVLTTLDLGSLTVVANLQLPGGVTGVAVGPNGYGYVTAINRVFEVDSHNPGVVRNEIDVNGTPNRPVFTTDGRYAVSTNRTPAAGSSIVLIFDVIAHTVAASIPNPSTGSLTLDPKLVLAGNNRIFATSSQSGGLYEISTSPASASSSTLLNSAIPSGATIQAIAASGEVPNGSAGARYLFVIASANNGFSIYRIDLTTNTVSGNTSIANPEYAVSFATAVPTTGAVTMLPFNNNQTVPAGTTSQPLVVRVLDANNLPVWNTPVTFSTTATGATLQNATVNTNAEGYAQTTVTVPTTAQQFTVTAAAGTTAATTTFALNVPGTGSGTGPGSGGGGTTTIVSGNGQLVNSNNQTTVPLVVAVADANGKPVTGTTVTFSVTQGSVTLSCGGSTSCSNGNGNPGGNGSSLVVTTDANGQAAISVLGSTSLNAGVSFEQSTVNATSLNGSVNFSVVTVASAQAGGQPALATAAELAPTLQNNRTITAQAGQTVKGAIVVALSANNGFPIPGAGLNLTNLDNAALPAPATCNGGEPLTDTTGTATCDLIATGKAGTYDIGVNIGNFTTLNPVMLVITPGAAGLIQITAGNNQTGNGGQQLPTALSAVVSDGYGNLLPGTQVTWAVTQGSATLKNTVNVADSGGHVSTLVTLGNTPGKVQVKVSAGSASATFNLTVNVTIGGLSIVSGNSQNSVVNQPFPQPLVVAVTDQNGKALAGAQVTFAVTSGSATLSPTSATADSSGHASTTATAGTTPGPIVITATAGNSSTTFNLTSRLPGPSITAASFVNAASFQPGLVPCGLATIFGSGLAPGISGSITAGQVTGAWPTTLGGDSVTIGGVNAPIYSVSNVNGSESVTIQAPCELTPGPTTAQVSVGGGSTTVSNVQVLAVQPGIFQYAINGQNFAVAFRPDGSLISPSNPAHYGETVRFIVTGLNQVTPATGTNHVGVPDQQINAQLIVGLNNSGATIESAQSLVGSIGLDIVAFDVPSGTATGSAQPLALAAVGSDGVTLTFGNSSLIAVAP